MFANYSSTASAARSAGGTPSNTGGRSDVAYALMEVATELAQNCPVPGVSEAASLMSFLVKLVSDSRGNNRGVEERLRRCRSVITLLQNAAKVFGKVRGGGSTNFQTNSQIASCLLAIRCWSCSSHSSAINIECLDKHIGKDLSPGSICNVSSLEPNKRMTTRMVRPSGIFSTTSATPSLIWWTLSKSIRTEKGFLRSSRRPCSSAAKRRRMRPSTGPSCARV